MNVSRSPLVVHSRNLDLSQDDGAIAHESTAHLDEILLDRKACELRVSESSCTRPHLWLVFVPIVARVNDFVLDLV